MNVMSVSTFMEVGVVPYVLDYVVSMLQARQDHSLVLVDLDGQSDQESVQSRVALFAKKGIDLCVTIISNDIASLYTGGGL